MLNMSCNMGPVIEEAPSLNTSNCEISSQDIIYWNRVYYVNFPYVGTAIVSWHSDYGHCVAAHIKCYCT